MSQRIIDVDAAGILTEPVQVRIRGDVFTLPGDVPAPLYAKLILVSGQGGDAGQETAADLYDELLTVFRQHQPDLARLPLGLNEMTTVVGYIYGGAHDQDEDTPAGAAAGGDGEDPTGPTPKTPTRRPRAAKRSTSST